MIAYDALLRAGESWVELANHGFFHGGDSDSTGVIVAAWWGALYAYKGVPKVNYKGLEYRARGKEAGPQDGHSSSRGFGRQWARNLLEVTPGNMEESQPEGRPGEGGRQWGSPPPPVQTKRVWTCPQPHGRTLLYRLGLVLLIFHLYS